MAHSFCIIIPARFQSTRFPGKPLAQIGGESMIKRVYNAASQIENAEAIVVATDNEEILQHVGQFGKAVHTASHHPSGTDRCNEAYLNANLQSDIVVNLQGDEPFIKAAQIEALLSLFENPAVQIATLKKEISDASEIQNPNVVKVVTAANGKALYFSRSAIPFNREQAPGVKYYRHIGMYAYRASVLNELTHLPISNLENTEKLEQLRWLENGYQIYVSETDWQSPAVDTPEDLIIAEAFYQNNY